MVTLENMEGWVFDGIRHYYSSLHNYAAISSINGGLAQGEQLFVHTLTNKYIRNENGTYDYV